MSDINLTLSTRANLLSLQTTKSLLDRTSNRLSTGLKVNAPIDNAPAFFAAQALTTRSSNFDKAATEINQAVQSLETALNGLRSIQKLVENAQGLMTSLKTASSLAGSDTIRVQYNQILSQIDLLAGDANYQGVNLINNATQTLELNFANEPGVVDLEVRGVRSDAAGLFLSTVAAGLFFQLQTTISSQFSRASIQSIPSTATVPSRASIAAVNALQSQASIASSQTISTFASQPSLASNSTNAFSVPSQASVASFESIASVASRASFEAVAQSFSAPSIASRGSVGSVASQTSIASAAGAVVAGPNLNLINSTELAIGQALAALTANQATLGSTNAILSVRLQFTQSYVSTLNGGASLLTVADLNLESANLTSLQTAQSLGVVSLQISTQSQQSILRLF